jgi:hypothetical protein
MILEVVIPTFKRFDKLKRTLGSIHNCMAMFKLCKENSSVRVKVCYSSPKDYEQGKEELGYEWIEHYLLEPYDDGFKLPRFWNDMLRACTADAMCYLTDDVLLNRYCLIIGAMEISKMEFDGVIGFSIENHTEPVQPCLASFGIVGIKYADRFKDRAIFCPEYTLLFADMELQKQAEKLGRFKFHTACSLVHFHPAYELDEMDDTHDHARRDYHEDVSMFRYRSNNNLIWGI